MITTDQIRAARALLRWTASELAGRSGVGVSTIRRLELQDGLPAGHIRTLTALKTALEAAGVRFVGTPEDSPGVVLVTRLK